MLFDKTIFFFDEIHPCGVRGLYEYICVTGRRRTNKIDEMHFFLTFYWLSTLILPLSSVHSTVHFWSFIVLVSYITLISSELLWKVPFYRWNALFAMFKLKKAMKYLAIFTFTMMQDCFLMGIRGQAFWCWMDYDWCFCAFWKRIWTYRLAPIW